MIQVRLPRDEMPHKGQVIEWWYFNGFLKGKKDYAFMTCLFKADGAKIGLPLFNVPVKNWYFSHTLLYDLKSKKITKEIIPLVVISDNSFKKKDLLIDYRSFLAKKYGDYEISEQNERFKIKTGFFDLSLKSEKKPLLEGGKGYVHVGKDSTYYFSYTHLDAKGFVGKDKVKGKVWHDKQWSKKNSKDASWVWFSLWLPNKTEIVCFDCKGKTMACISYPNSKQKCVKAEIKPLGKKWKSKITGTEYYTSWRIKAGEFNIVTKPILKECEMCFGALNYWEGPISARVNGKKARGFMELVSDKRTVSFLPLLKEAESEALQIIKDLEKRFLNR